MKKLLLLALVVLSAFLLVGNRSQTVSSQVLRKDRFQKLPVGPVDKNKELLDTVAKLANRSTDGLRVQKAPSGGEFINFNGGFQNVMLAKVDENGELPSACVTSTEEAAAFLSKPSENDPASLVFLRDPLAEVAARHGMSAEEFEFYSKMIEAYYQRQMSPESATLTIVNNDGAGEGFNDPTAKPVDGANPGTTLGAQRLNLFNFAATIWGSFLDSSVTIGVRSQFDPQTCTPTSAVLGSAGALASARNFPNAQFTNTWYQVALANKRVGSDLDPANPDINATFNSLVSGTAGCLDSGGTPRRFYYGFDNTTPANTINLLVVLLHEMGHGLGFATITNGSTGAQTSGSPHIYDRFMFDRTTGLYWDQMTNPQRVASALNTGNLLWDGPNVKIASGALTTGREVATGRVQLFAPNPFQGGSSVSHFDTAAGPNLLMEPAINVGLPIDLDLTRQQMRDIGWYRDTTMDLVPDTITNVAPGGGNVIIGSLTNITWTNNGGFNRNITIELSTDGGVTYPTIIASNFPNSGTYPWMVPNTPTSQARVRVREYDFVDPIGISVSNFNIVAAPTAAEVSIGGRVTTRDGRGIYRAMVTVVDAQGHSRMALSNAFGYYRIYNLDAGTTYVVNTNHKQYRFAPRTVNLFDDLADFDFVALP